MPHVRAAARSGSAALTRLVVLPVTLLAACAPQPAPVLDSASTSAAGSAGMLLVANQQGSSASIVELGSGRVTTITVGAGPHEAAISPDGRIGVVTIYGGGQAAGNQLAVIDMERRSLERTIDLGRFTRPHDVAFLPGSSRRVAVTSEATQRVVVVDLERGTVTAEVETHAAGSHMLALAADGSTLFTTNVSAGSVSQLDLTRGAFVREIEVAPRVEGIAITPDGRELWVGSNQHGSVTVLDVASGTVAARLEQLGVPYRIAISPAGTRALIADPTSDQVHVADVATRTIIGAIPVGGSPRGVLIASDDRTAFVTLGPEGVVAVVDLVERRVLSHHGVGSAPDGVGWGIPPAGPGPR